MGNVNSTKGNDTPYTPPSPPRGVARRGSGFNLGQGQMGLNFEAIAQQGMMAPLQNQPVTPTPALASQLEAQEPYTAPSSSSPQENQRIEQIRHEAQMVFLEHGTMPGEFQIDFRSHIGSQNGTAQTRVTAQTSASPRSSPTPTQSPVVSPREIPKSKERTIASPREYQTTPEGVHYLYDPTKASVYCELASLLNPYAATLSPEEKRGIAKRLISSLSDVFVRRAVLSSDRSCLKLFAKSEHSTSLCKVRLLSILFQTLCDLGVAPEMAVEFLNDRQKTEALMQQLRRLGCLTMKGDKDFSFDLRGFSSFKVLVQNELKGISIAARELVNLLPGGLKAHYLSQPKPAEKPRAPTTRATTTQTTHTQPIARVDREAEKPKPPSSPPVSPSVSPRKGNMTGRSVTTQTRSPHLSLRKYQHQTAEGIRYSREGDHFYFDMASLSQGEYAKVSEEERGVIESAFVTIALRAFNVKAVEIVSGELCLDISNKTKEEKGNFLLGFRLMPVLMRELCDLGFAFFEAADFLTNPDKTALLSQELVAVGCLVWHEKGDVIQMSYHSYPSLHALFDAVIERGTPQEKEAFKGLLVLYDMIRAVKGKQKAPPLTVEKERSPKKPQDTIASPPASPRSLLPENTKVPASPKKPAKKNLPPVPLRSTSSPQDLLSLEKNATGELSFSLERLFGFNHTEFSNLPETKKTPLLMGIREVFKAQFGVAIGMTFDFKSAQTKLTIFPEDEQKARVAGSVSYTVLKFCAELGMSWDDMVLFLNDQRAFRGVIDVFGRIGTWTFSGDHFENHLKEMTADMFLKDSAQKSPEFFYELCKICALLLANRAARAMGEFVFRNVIDPVFTEYSKNQPMVGFSILQNRYCEVKDLMG